MINTARLSEEKSLINIIYSIVLAAFTMWILNMYLNIFLESKGKLLRKLCVWSISFIIWAYKEYNKGWTPGVNILLSIFIGMIIASTLYNGKYIIKLLFIVLLNMLWMGAELLIGYGFILFGIDYSERMLAGTIFSLLFIILFVRILALHNKYKSNAKISLKYVYLLAFNTCGSVFIAHTLFFLSSMNKASVEMTYISSLVVVVINILNFRIYNILSEEYDVKRKNAVYEQQVEFYKNHIKEKEEILLKIREMQHETKNQFIFILGLLEHEEIIRAKKFINQNIREINNIKNNFAHSNNIVIDSLINYKFSIAEKKKILLDIKINIWINLPVDDGDICILLGNAIDNAIEATLKVQEKDRFINLYIRCIKNTLVITMVNSYDKTVHSVNGNLISTKKDRENHGMGLVSMRKVVDKYNGIILIDEGEFFSIKIVLYL